MRKNDYICTDLSTVGKSLKKKEKRIMAKPIKETPILYDEDAYRFEMAAQNVVPLPVEEQEEMWANYQELRQKCAFSL